MNALRTWAAASLLTLLAGCSTFIDNAPRNRPISEAAARVPPPRDIVQADVIGLSFSGGGLRAAAFSLGVLQALADPAAGDVLDDVTFISSVSGGSLTAAYYGLHGRAGLAPFRDTVLYRDFEVTMRMSTWSPENLLRLLRGGVNDRSNLAETLDRDVFRGATFADLHRRGRPDIWINATDLYNRTPFPFIAPMFDALCSDLGALPVAEAVHASMAVPLVFAPVVLHTFPNQCRTSLPPWVETHASDLTSPLMQAAAQALRSYRDPAILRFVKLVDGGVTDNAGLSSILIARAVSGTSYGPFTALDAVRVRRMLFLIVDAGRGPGGDWALSPEGPAGVDVALAATDSAVDAAARIAVASFPQALRQWRDDIVRFRCGLSAQERAALGVNDPQWRCDDVSFAVSRVGFWDLPAARAQRLNAIPTRLTLQREQIDEAIDAGRAAALANAGLRAYRSQRVGGR